MDFVENRSFVERRVLQKDGFFRKVGFVERRVFQKSGVL